MDWREPPQKTDEDKQTRGTIGPEEMQNQEAEVLKKIQSGPQKLPMQS